ncbi:MAG: ISL3 family transposase [Thermodesulfobacteriota bacterium]|nr:ISL3 family transposase [Thermodesulfobacteriota bacterium]
MDMLSSLFEKALKLDPPWEVKRIELHEDNKTVNIFIDFPKGSLFACPKCGKPSKAYDTTEKKWRHLNFFQYECHLIVRMPRTECKEDGILQVESSWARSGADFTLLFESFAMTLCREMPINTVSRIIGEDDNKLWRMVRYYVEEARGCEYYSSVSSIGVDETSAKKGHDYVTLVVDLKEKKTIFVARGKDAATLETFREDLIEHHGSPDNATNASIDMSPAFIRGIEDNFPMAEITFDKFHIMKIINNAVDEVRKEEIREQDILRGTKYLWLKNRENLTDAQKETLMAIESMPHQNMKTVRTLHIRENFQLIYKEPTGESFERMLKKWYFWATHSRIPSIIGAAKTIKAHWSGVLSWHKSKIDNGILEGINGLIQAAKAKARGYRTFENFKNIIYLVTGKLDFSKTGLPT